MRIHISRSPNLVFERAADGSSILFDPAADVAHALNPAATRVWEALVEGGDEASIRRLLAEGHGQDVSEVAVYNTLAQFKEAGLVQTDADALLVEHASRRETILRLSLGVAAAVVFPLIQSLTGTEQRAYVLQAQSVDSGQA